MLDGLRPEKDAARCSATEHALKMVVWLPGCDFYTLCLAARGNCQNQTPSRRCTALHGLREGTCSTPQTLVCVCKKHHAVTILKIKSSGFSVVSRCGSSLDALIYDQSHPPYHASLGLKPQNSSGFGRVSSRRCFFLPESPSTDVTRRDTPRPHTGPTQAWRPKRSTCALSSRLQRPTGPGSRYCTSRQRHRTARCCPRQKPR